MRSLFRHKKYEVGTKKLSVEEALNVVKTTPNFKTRDGSYAIVETNRNSDKPGYLYQFSGCLLTKGKRWETITWTKEGRFHAESEGHPFDLVEYLGPELAEKAEKEKWELDGFLISSEIVHLPGSIQIEDKTLIIGHSPEDTTLSKKVRIIVKVL